MIYTTYITQGPRASVHIIYSVLYEVLGDMITSSDRRRVLPICTHVYRAIQYRSPCPAGSITIDTYAQDDVQQQYSVPISLVPRCYYILLYSRRYEYIPLAPGVQCAQTTAPDKPSSRCSQASSRGCRRQRTPPQCTRSRSLAPRSRSSPLSSGTTPGRSWRWSWGAGIAASWELSSPSWRLSYPRRCWRWLLWGRPSWGWPHESPEKRCLLHLQYKHKYWKDHKGYWEMLSVVSGFGMGALQNQQQRQHQQHSSTSKQEQLNSHDGFNSTAACRSLSFSVSVGVGVGGGWLTSIIYAAVL